jgi:hypothetical protein
VEAVIIGDVVAAMIDNDTIAVAVTYAAFALLGPWTVTQLARWAESDHARNLAGEIACVIEEVTR